MSRLLAKNGSQKKFIDAIRKKSGLTLKAISEICDKNQKTLSDWSTEKSSMSYESAVLLSNKFSVSLPAGSKKVSDFWYTQKAGKIGGAICNAKYGNPGTAEGRKLGGKRSLIIHQTLKTGFKIRKNIKLPKHDKLLAEFIGIVLGDGGITYHQVTVSLNSQSDKEYGDWIVVFIKSLFDLEVTSKERHKNDRHLITTSVNLVEFLVKTGLSRGNKVKNQIDIPNWIKKNKKFQIACIRGLIDTDGCIYIDKHKHKNKIYRNICLDFTNASIKLLESVYKILDGLNLEPRKYSKSIKIRKEAKVKKYFEIIGTHNSKHLNKFNKFINGEVA